MEKEFVPYELAVKLKELGFDNIECLGAYSDCNKKLEIHEWICHGIHYTLAPLWQQAFDWFRVMCLLNTNINPDQWNDGLWQYEIRSVDKKIVLDPICDPKHWIRNGCFKTYEQARYACLEKLIELIQNKNDRSI